MGCVRGLGGGERRCNSCRGIFYIIINEIKATNLQIEPLLCSKWPQIDSQTWASGAAAIVVVFLMAEGGKGVLILLRHFFQLDYCKCNLQAKGRA